MTSYCDVANNVYPVTMTTIRHCSILEFGRGGIQSSSRPEHYQTSSRHWVETFYFWYFFSATVFKLSPLTSVFNEVVHEPLSMSSETTIMWKVWGLTKMYTVFHREIVANASLNDQVWFARRWVDWRECSFQGELSKKRKKHYFNAHLELLTTDEKNGIKKCGTLTSL